jgi:fructuronate reductase
VPAITRRASTLDPAKVGIGIVHIGLGAFHRAHQAVYVERYLNRTGGGDWGICAANIRSNREIVDRLTAQGCRYHVAEYADAGHVALAEVRAIREALFAATDKRRLLARMTDPATKIVSLTVTEKGYGLSPAAGELKLDDAAVAHDLATPADPETAPGLVLEALRQRRDRGIGPFTVLCCDNMPDNGARTRHAVSALAARQSQPLQAFVQESVAFPATMVDRIVPAVTAGRLETLAELIGEADPAAVACERFSQWVIEDRFSAGRPDWEADGVEMVDDVRPFESMKLRMLNGAHSLIAYVGLHRGFDTVAEAIADPAVAALVRDFFAEAAATLAPTPGIEPEAYAAALLDRFANDALAHRLSQIAMDGSQKLPQRMLDAARINLEQGRGISATAAAVAAWIAYVRGADDAGNKWAVDDPLAVELAACHAGNRKLDDIVAAILSISAIFPAALAAHPGFRTAVTGAYTRLLADRAQP